MTEEHLVIVLLVILLGFLPALWAGLKRHHQVDAIAALNLLSFVPAGVGLFIIVTSGDGALSIVLAANMGMQPLTVGFVMWSTALVWSLTIVRHDLKRQLEAHLKGQLEAHQQGQPAARRRPG